MQSFLQVEIDTETPFSPTGSLKYATEDRLDATNEPGHQFVRNSNAAVLFLKISFNLQFSISELNTQSYF